MFLRKYWIPLLVFIVAVVGVGLYYLQTRPPKDPILIVKPVEYEKPPAKAPVVEQPEQVGHFHEDGTFHAESDEKFESDAEFKARMDKYNAEMAAAKTARERNEVTMRRIEASPYFYIQENYYNFLKAHPDYDGNTASPELRQKLWDALNADAAKMRAETAAQEAAYEEYERNRKPVDMRPSIVTRNGTIYLDEGDDE